LRRSDLLRAQWQLVMRKPIWLAVFAACFATSLVRSWPLAPAGKNVIAIASALLTAFLFTALGVLLAYLFAMPAMWIRLRSTPGALGKHLYEVGEDGLREVSDSREVRVAPGHAHRLIRTRSHIVAVTSLGAGCVLTRRDFVDTAAYDDFWKAMQPLVGAKKS
jgi:hypothetical protein